MDPLWGEHYLAWCRDLSGAGASCESGYLPFRGDQQRLAYAYFQPLAPKGCTVLIHGTGNDALFGWQAWIEGLLQAGQAVLSFDLEGHGRSSTSLLDRSSFGLSLAAIQSLLSRLSWSLENITLCGYSLGALAALRSLSDRSIQAGRLIILSMPLQLEIGLSFGLWEAASVLHPHFWQHCAHYGWQASLPAFGDWRRDRYPIRLSGFTNASYTRCVRELFTLSKPLELAQRVEIPTLLIYGSLDRLSSCEEQKTLRRHIPNATLVRLMGSNHFLLPWHPRALEAALRFVSRDGRLPRS